MYFSRKIEKEKIRKEVLDHNYQVGINIRPRNKRT